MNLTAKEVTVLRGLVEQNINTVTMIGLSDFTVDGVDLKALLNKLDGGDFLEVPELGSVAAGTVTVILDTGSNKVAMIRVARMLTGWGLKEAVDHVNANNRAEGSGGYRIELTVHKNDSILSTIQQLRREGVILHTWVN